jgi:hypothetical protein
MNSVAIEFAADGLTAVVSARAVRRATPPAVGDRSAGS